MRFIHLPLELIRFIHSPPTMQLHLCEFVKGQTVYTIGVYVCDRSRQIFLDYYYSLFLKLTFRRVNLIGNSLVNRASTKVSLQ